MLSARPAVSSPHSRSLRGSAPSLRGSTARPVPARAREVRNASPILNRPLVSAERPQKRSPRCPYQRAARSTRKAADSSAYCSRRPVGDATHVSSRHRRLAQRRGYRSSRLKAHLESGERCPAERRKTKYLGILLARQIIDPGENRDARINFVFRRNIHERVIFNVEIRSAEIQFLARVDELRFDRRPQFLRPQIR